MLERALMNSKCLLEWELARRSCSKQSREQFNIRSFLSAYQTSQEHHKSKILPTAKIDFNSIVSSHCERKEKYDNDYSREKNLFWAREINFSYITSLQIIWFFSTIPFIGAERSPRMSPGGCVTSFVTAPSLQIRLKNIRWWCSPWVSAGLGFSSLEAWIIFVENIWRMMHACIYWV